MNKLDQDYQNLLNDILVNGIKKEDRTGVGTLSVFSRQLRHKMSDGFPLLTSKKMAWKQIVVELLWFLRGESNIQYLIENNCNIWNGDCYKNYQKIAGKYEEPDYDVHIDDPNENRVRLMTQTEFVERLLADPKFAYKWGELGPIYGVQWRSWRGSKYAELNIKNPETGKPLYSQYSVEIDQFENLIRNIQDNPDSRRLMVNAWNSASIDEMVLPPCHYGFQIYTRELSWEEKVQWVMKNTNVDWENVYITEEVYKKSTPTRAISLSFNMRSTDVPLGLPFNIASYALLLEIIGKMVNMVPDELVANLGDAHIYLNQIDGVKEHLSRSSFALPKLTTNKTREFYQDLSKDLSLIFHLEPSDFSITNYKSNPKIDFPLNN
jgi:thymidylate synthase